MNKCYYCFSDISDDEKCPNCGHDNSAYEPKAYHLPIGTAVGGRYIIGAVIGEGGFGITYSAFDKRMNARCAIKEYYPRQISGRGNTDKERTRVFSVSGMEHDYAAGLERFRSEAKRLAKFDGIRNIVNVKNYISENGTGYIIMNYVSGISLKELLNQRGGKLPADETFALIEPLLRAISVIQRDGVIHRDISPDNIMYSDDKALVLIDFGSAREYDSEKSMSVILKHGYAPPEQYSSVGKQGPWTDIYSVCATIYRMITGTVPNEAMDRIDGTAAVKKPSELGIRLPHYREEALMKGLELEAEKRWQTADELYTALYLAKEEKKHPYGKGIAALSAAAVIGITAASVIISRENDDPAAASADTTASFSETVSVTQTEPETTAAEAETTAAESETSEESSTTVKSEAEETEITTTEEIIYPIEGVLENGSWTLNEEGALTISASGVLEPEGEEWERIKPLVLSADIQGDITEIGSGTFEQFENMEKAVLPPTVRIIGRNAFKDCAVLSSINLDNITEIGDSAFFGSGLSELTIPASVSTIGMQAFSQSKIENVVFSGNDISIGTKAFSKCASLKKLHIAGNVKWDTRAFEKCTSLADVTVEDGVEHLGEKTFSGCSGLENMNFPSSIRDSFNYDFPLAPDRHEDERPFTDYFPKNVVTSIPFDFMDSGAKPYNMTELTVSENAAVKFYDSAELMVNDDGSLILDENGTALTLPEEEGRTYYHSFQLNPGFSGASDRVNGVPCFLIAGLECVKKINVLSGIETICINHCPDVESISLPDSIKSAEILSCDNLKSIDIPNKLKDLRIDYPDSIEELSIDGEIENLQIISYGNAQKKKLTLSCSSKRVYINCSDLSELNITGNIGSLYIYDTPIMSLKLSSVTGDLCIYKCDSLESLNIPEGVTALTAGAIYDCSSIREITLPSSLVTIGTEPVERDWWEIFYDNFDSWEHASQNMFNHCDSLKKITLSADSQLDDQSRKYLTDRCVDRRITLMKGDEVLYRPMKYEIPAEYSY